MLLRRLAALFHDLADLAQTDCEGPLILVCNTGLEAWALLDPFSELDCMQFFEDRRNTMLCVVTGDMVRGLPDSIRFDELHDSLIHHALNIAPSPQQIPLGFLLDQCNPGPVPTDKPAT